MSEMNEESKDKYPGLREAIRLAIAEWCAHADMREDSEVDAVESAVIAWLARHGESQNSRPAPRVTGEHNSAFATGGGNYPEDEGGPSGSLVFPALIEDIRERDRIGKAEYSKELTTFDGRDSLRDAYEEALDLSVYLKKCIMEREQPSPGLEASRPDVETAQGSSRWVIYNQMDNSKIADRIRELEREMAVRDYALNEIRRWLKDGATISAFDLKRPVLEFLPDGSLIGGMTIDYSKEEAQLGEHP